MSIEIRPATTETIQSYLGYLPDHRVRAFVAVNDDEEVIGIGGLHFLKWGVEVFSQVEDELKAHPKLLYKTAKEVVRLASEYNAAATLDVNEPSAERFLTRLGFYRDGPVWRL
jgi:hypothetical protein